MSKGIVLDIGTGNGKFAYTLAKQNPEKLIVGIDPNQSNLVKISSKIYKRPSRGGLPNALFVLADIDNLPMELTNSVNQIFILFPWGSLLRAIVNVEKQAWSNLHRVCQKGAILDIVFGYDKNKDIREVRNLNLPLLDEHYVKRKMIPEIERLGFTISKIEIVGSMSIKNLPTTWAKKLSQRKDRKYYYLHLQKCCSPHLPEI